MRFQDAVASADDVRESYRPGLQALLKRDRNKLSCKNTRKISGSLHLDAAVEGLYPNQPRWDYGVGIKTTEIRDRAIWLEIHPADAHEVQRVIEKRTWLRNWLRTGRRI